MDNVLQKALFDKGMIPAYNKLADLSSLRHKLIASNIANVSTTGYLKKEIEFDKELRKAMGKPKIASNITDPRHIPLGNTPGAPPKVKQIKETENSTGVNSVDIDQEMAELAQNQLVFDFGAMMLGKKFKSLKSAIRGRE
jgi:flagellar basal-body rod protein FlgB